MNDKESYHKRIATIEAILFLILLLSSVYLWNAEPSADEPAWLVWVDRILILILFAFLVISWVTGIEEVGPNENGLILYWGKPMFQIGSGFIWLPARKIWSLHRETKLVIEERYPKDENTNSENIAPIYITHGASTVVSSDPLDHRITTSVSIVCRYKIVDLKMFITKIGDKEQLRKQIRDVVVTTAQVECSKATVGANFNRLTEINTELKSAVEILTHDWGIKIESVLLQNIDLGGAINEALRNVPISIINKEVNKNNAQKIMYEGLAHADVHKAFQYARAEGFKIIARELNISEPVVIYQLDTLANMWRKNNTGINLFSGDMAEVFKMVTAFAKVIDDKKLSD